jgi:hypothetical protein
VPPNPPPKRSSLRRASLMLRTAPPRGLFLCRRETDDQRHRSGVDDSKRFIDSQRAALCFSSAYPLTGPASCGAFSSPPAELFVKLTSTPPSNAGNPVSIKGPDLRLFVPPASAHARLPVGAIFTGACARHGPRR